jgi:hypothetical protein
MSSWALMLGVVARAGCGASVGGVSGVGIGVGAGDGLEMVLGSCN